ncbi:MAG: OB-fold domain-containing protein [Halodesulfurarchaeum sp.]
MIDLSGETGTVRTWTTIETSAPGVREPNTLAIVDFAIGGTTVRTLGQVTTDAVGIGTEVRPTFVSELRDPDPSFRRTDSQSWGGHRFEPVE